LVLARTRTARTHWALHLDCQGLHPGLAASRWPDPYVFEIYDEQNIRAVVNCCEFDNRREVPSQFVYHQITTCPNTACRPMRRSSASVTLMDKQHAAREAVVVHCGAGCGRTGSSSSPSARRRTSSRRKLIRCSGFGTAKILPGKPRAERLRQAVSAQAVHKTLSLRAFFQSEGIRAKHHASTHLLQTVCIQSKRG
jgi:hypothetical protein